MIIDIVLRDFVFNKSSIRDFDNPWFVLKDICNILGFKIISVRIT